MRSRRAQAASFNASASHRSLGWPDIYRSINRPAPGKVESKARRKAAGGRHDPGDHRSSLVKLAAAVHWDLVGHVFDLRLGKRGNHRCTDDRRSKGVDGDAGLGIVL